MNGALNWKGKSTIGLLVAAVALAMVSVPRLESAAPTITGPATLAVGTAGAELELQLEDANTGLRSVQMKIVHGGGGQIVFEEEFPGGLFSGADSDVAQTVRVSLEPKALRLADGPATLIVTARDWSWRNGGAGNRSEVNVRLVVDTKPPRVIPSGGLIYIYRGGAAAATYSVDEATTTDGVRVGDHFYSGYPVPGTHESDGQRVAFFAVAVHAPANPVIEIQATDQANNLTSVRLRAKVFERKFPEERLSLSKSFFDRVMPALSEKVGVSAPSNLEAFQIINREVRNHNEEKIRSLVATSDAQRHWSRPFVQLPNSKVMSRFAEQRRYFNGNEEISQATHYGFDLASRAAADVIAANRGRVLFAGELGIYGNCVLVDHGLGITTLYAHLTDFAVQVDEMVERKQVLGRTGTTGLAGGDHLHFAILVGGTYVDPLEWWDARWIKSHVEVKLAASGP
ncbi:MAG: M23 family metallopeptidase [Deltaproteobacteria bacterium]|nr:M23 family metallopeptidase [Deltaproteobacteria bacterium]MBW2724973.1 M23 family metallopeptidase [Deltaproteobacteria bacterium]